MTVTVAWKPPVQLLSRWKEALQVPLPPEGATVGVGVAVGSEVVLIVGVAVGLFVGLGVTVGVGLGVGLTVGVGVAAPPPVTDAEKLLTARPTPPLDGSKPFWMLLRYHELVPYLEPRLSVSLTKSITLKLKGFAIPEPTYETTLFEPLLPSQTFHEEPARLTVPVCEPIGQTDPA